MNKADILRIFGLPPDASHNDIKKRYRELSKDFHPDGGGNKEVFNMLTNLQELAFDSDDERHLVPLEDVLSLIAKRESEKEKKQALTEKSIDKIVRSQSNKIKYRKIISGSLGIILVGLGFFADKILPLFKDFIYYPWVQLAFLVVALLSGCLFVSTDLKLKKFKQLVDDINDYFDDKSVYIEFLRDLSSYSYVSRAWTRDELTKDVKRWLVSEKGVSEYRELDLDKWLIIKRFASEVGEFDFTLFLIRKGLEQNILVEKETVHDNRLTIEYNFYFVNAPAEGNSTNSDEDL